MGSRIVELANKLENNNQGNNNDGNGDNPPTIVYSPQIIIQGNANKNDVNDALKMSQAEFNKMMAKYLKTKDRVKL